MSSHEAWLPESERDSRWYLWNERYMCRVPFIQTMSPDYLREFGMPSSGYDEYDRQTANELVIRMLTINDMVEYYKRGTTVAVMQPGDTKRIYERISTHLELWKRELETSFHTRNAPLEDLQDLDKFAHAVYEHAKWYFDEPFVESLFARSVGGLLGFNRNSIVKRKSTSRVLEVGQEAEMPAEPAKPQSRVSMAEVFASREAAAKLPWERRS